ncbi:hypothetical protein [Lysinibacillus sp. Bpr_S20]|uniref:hypothetical protein n=1 Tax=Lysinibacillus sp. Bpr_S20 TaxID=2933964 RepID=UPI002012BEEE|nr:hypothetical protein [Lysinibacillus sp. Bpr_S20]MCL1700647.1 hypothetical protein [Lysinibacillus sp. Bpr_S20]
MEKDQSQYIEQCIINYEEIVKDAKEGATQDHELLEEITKSMSFGLIKTNYDIWLDECLIHQDWQKLNNLIFQEMRYQLLPGCSGGYDHCNNTLHILEAFACGDNETMERILPSELGLTKNGYPFYVVMSNLLRAMWYRDEILLQKALNAAEKFVGLNKPQWERSGAAFLLALHKEDIEAMGEHLQNLCSGYMRADFSKAMKQLCVPAHGLYCLAQNLLPAQIFQQIKMPEHKNFSKGFANWRIENPQPLLTLYFVYPAPLEVLNKIFMAPVAKSIISQPYLHSDNSYHSPQLKKKWFLDEAAMLKSFVENM